jgi:hypothetical protein
MDGLSLAIETASRAYGGQFNNIIIISHASGAPGPALDLNKDKNTPRVTAENIAGMRDAIQKALKPNGKLVISSCGYYFNLCNGPNHSIGTVTPATVKLAYETNLQTFANVTERTVLFDPWLSQPSPTYGSIPHKPGLFLNESDYVQNMEKRMLANPD